MNRFENKTILVTGAGSGIGAATVRRLFAEGASIVAADIQKEDVDTVVSEFGESDRIYSVELDISDRDRVTDFVAGAVRRFGRLDGLVNSNLEGTFNVCHAFAVAVKEAKNPASIVNLSSAAGIRGVPNRISYAASKYGVVGITQTMALELGPIGIRVNAAVPGTIHTPMTQSMFDDPENVERIRAAHPLRREGQPEDVAGVIAFLLSDDAAFVTGVALPIDGGKSAGLASF
jgi:NAD(P)-dependent dehydrogenase (short-subunit alcohol dehydrogenase family)